VSRRGQPSEANSSLWVLGIERRGAARAAVRQGGGGAPVGAEGAVLAQGCAPHAVLLNLLVQRLHQPARTRAFGGINRAVDQPQTTNTALTINSICSPCPRQQDQVQRRPGDQQHAGGFSSKSLSKPCLNPRTPHTHDQAPHTHPVILSSRSRLRRSARLASSSLAFLAAARAFSRCLRARVRARGGGEARFRRSGEHPRVEQVESG
jgi:hypothetical protein